MTDRPIQSRVLLTPAPPGPGRLRTVILPLARACLLALALLPLGCLDQPQPALRVGTNVWPGYEPLYLARETGLLRSGEARLIEYPSATEVLRGFRNHSIDAAALTFDEVMLLAQDDVDCAVVLVMDLSAGGDVILGRPGLDSMADLRGRRVGLERTALGAFFLPRALQECGMVDAEITAVDLQVHEHARAFREGEVDAVVTFDPVRSELLAEGAELLFDSSRIPGEIVDVLVVHGEVLRQRRPAVRRLVQQWFRALEWMAQEPDQASGLIAPRLKLAPEEVLQAYDGLVLPDLEQNRRLLGGETPELMVSGRRLAGFLLTADLLQRPVEVLPLLDPGCLGQEQP